MNKSQLQGRTESTVADEEPEGGTEGNADAFQPKVDKRTQTTEPQCNRLILQQLRIFSLSSLNNRL